MKLGEDSSERMRLNREILLVYAPPPYVRLSDLYQREPGWERVRRNLRKYCEEGGIHIEYNEYPRRLSLIITLTI